MLKPNLSRGFLLAALGLLLAACQPASPPAQPGLVKVVATTSIVGDIVAQIGADTISLTILLPPGADPHSYEPSPQDIARVAEADLVFANGAGLEGFLQTLIENAGGRAGLVDLSEGLSLRTLAESTEADPDHASTHPSTDPHTWFDPRNVIAWANTIAAHLASAAPSHAATYAANAAAYAAELEALDTWAQAQFAQIPLENRLLVTDHDNLGYLADRYGFQMAGAVIPGFSALAQPSAQEMAALQQAIKSLGARAVFVGSTVNPQLAETLARDTGIELIPLFTDALSGPSGPAATYLDMMRFDIIAIATALR